MSTDAGAGPPVAVHRNGPGTERSPRRRLAVVVLVSLALVALAGGLRLYRLGEPPRIYFDETYYVEDARALLAVGTETDFAVHPPLGKWLIAGGITTLGDRPVGWRAPVALAGTLTVLTTYLLGLRLFRWRGAAALAALLLAVDGLAFVMSRITMLDAFVALFVVVGFWLLLVDRDRQWAQLPDHDAPVGPPRLGHPHRWLAGLVFGLALATKWSALLAIGAAGLFVAGVELAWRRRWTGSPWTRVWAPALGVLGALVLVPAVVYVASYSGWFVNVADTRVGRQHCPGETCPRALPEAAGAWWDEQRAIAEFHLDLEAAHPYKSPAATWLVLRRPVAYYYEACPEPAPDCAVAVGTVRHILGLGNPVIWWAALLGYPALAWLAVRHRDWRAWALLAFLAGQYVPWLLARRPLFLFYMTPVVPFMCLSLAVLVDHAADRRWARWLSWGVAGAAVAAFVFWYPVLAGAPIDAQGWQLRMLFHSWI